MNLTVEQRRKIVEYLAGECVLTMPSEDIAKAEFFRDLHSEEWRIRTMKAIEKVIPELTWDLLLEELLDYQTFDRDPEGYIYQYAYDDTVERVREYLNDEISVRIDNVARY